ncbi:MAG: hypothetical protein RSE12_19480 [Fuscovulum sp.]|nr:MAG: hypothetical protein RSE12_19480 [Fuscovulum sp.]
MEFLLLALLGLGAASLLGGSESPDSPSGGGNQNDDDGDDPPDDNDEGRRIELKSGVRNPAGGSGNDTFVGIAEGDVLAGGGDDRFDFEDGYGARIFGGDGNETLTSAGDNYVLHGDAGNDLISFSASAFDGQAAYGGNGNDTLSVAFPDIPNAAGAVLGGGRGADTFDLTFNAWPDADQRQADFVTLKDFKPGEDRLNIKADNFSRAELIENSENGFTDLRLYHSVTNQNGEVVERYSTIRMEGITGANLESLGVNLPPAPAIPDDQGRRYDIAPGGLSSVTGGAGNDTITGIAGGSFLGGGGDDRFDIETGADSVLDGGAGNDTLNVGESANMNVLGGAGNDVLNIDSTSNTQETSTINGGDGDDNLNIGIALNDPFAQRVDTVSGGAGADTFTLDVKDVTSGADFSTDTMLVIDDFSQAEDDLIINIRPEDAPYFKGASLVENPQDGSTDLVLTFQRPDENGVMQEWTGTIKLMATSGLVLADDGPIQVKTAA